MHVFYSEMFGHLTTIISWLRHMRHSRLCGHGCGVLDDVFVVCFMRGIVAVNAGLLKRSRTALIDKAHYLTALLATTHAAQYKPRGHNVVPTLAGLIPTIKATASGVSEAVAFIFYKEEERRRNSATGRGIFERSCLQKWHIKT